MTLGLTTPPSWLQQWLSIPFYEDQTKYKCIKHPCKYLTVFCGSCRGNPVCEICWKTESINHDHDHPVLQVCIASRRAAIETSIMSRFMDTSHIQEYSINHKNVVYLKPNEKACSEKKHDIPKCETCRRKLKDIDYGFCSIACKVATISSGQCLQIEENIETVTTKTCPKIEEEKTETVQTKSPKRKRVQSPANNSEQIQYKRIHKRKGIPQRSPLM